MTRKASTNRARAELALSVAVHPSLRKASCFIAAFLFELDARIQPFVKNVNDQVDKNICHCDFFFQAEDGIRDADVTGVQTCALPIFT